MKSKITVNGVYVDIPIYDVSKTSLKKNIANKITSALGLDQKIGESSNYAIVRALQNITIEIKSGDRIGIVGKNGAGKSTLLRVLGGIYEPTQGDITINGSVATLLDLTLGMDDEESGAANIYLRGLILGKSTEEISNVFDEIVDFSGLGEFINLPIRTYSNGMKLRLAFSISTAFTADILILDEVIGVGDQDFLRKANERLDKLHEKSEIVILTSHSNEIISTVCNKALYMEAGRIKGFGSVDEIISEYTSDRP